MPVSVDELDGPGVHVEARRVLVEAGADVDRVIRVDPDAILYIDSLDRPHTGWLRHAGAQLVIVIESGFPPFPSASTLRRMPSLTADASILP